MARNKMIVVLVFLAAAIGGSIAAFPFGRVYPFPITNTLECHRVTSNGLVLEEIPFLPLVPAPSGMVWLPQDSGFRIPRFPTNRLAPGEATLQETLLEFLGNDYNPIIQSVVEPSRDAPRACDIVGTIEGSAGQLLRFNEVEEWSTADILRTIANLRNDIAPNLPDEDQADLFETINTVIVRLDNINQQPELCEIYTGVCPLVTEWTDLGLTYFPRFYAAGLCSGKNCSFPRGQTCEPDIRNDRVSSVIVLRWDCCFNPDPNFFIAPRWECGWRRVRVPIICDCRCGCGPFIDLSPLDPALVSP